MSNEDLIKDAIKEYREEREQFRRGIKILEQEEYLSFKRMLDKINALSDCADTASIYSEFEASLD